MDDVRTHLVDDRDQGFANQLEPADLVHLLRSRPSATDRRQDLMRPCPYHCTLLGRIRARAPHTDGEDTK